MIILWMPKVRLKAVSIYSLDFKIGRTIFAKAWKARRIFTPTSREVRLDFNIQLDGIQAKGKFFKGAISSIQTVKPDAFGNLKRDAIKKKIVIWVHTKNPFTDGLGYSPKAFAKICPLFDPEGKKFLKGVEVLEFMSEFPPETFS